MSSPWATAVIVFTSFLLAALAAITVMSTVGFEWQIQNGPVDPCGYYGNCK